MSRFHCGRTCALRGTQAARDLPATLATAGRRANRSDAMTVTKLSSTQAKKRTSLKERVSEAEWKVRTDLAAAYQLAVVYGWTDMILTHFSARVPDAENQFLLNAYGLMFDEVTASNLVKIDHEGNIVEDITGFGVN